MIPHSASRIQDALRIPGAIALAVLCSALIGADASSLSPRVYVVNERLDRVSIIDTATLGVVAQVPTGSRPRHVAVDPKGRFFYVTVLFTPDSDDLVQVFEVETNRFVTSVVVGHQPAQVVPDSTGERLYVTSEAGNSLSVISVPAFKRIETIKLKGKGPHGQVISPDGRNVVVPNGRSSDVSVVDVTRGTVDLV